MKHFEAAETIKPSDNEEAVLRWNRCVRLLQTHPSLRAAIVAPREDQVHLGD